MKRETEALGCCDGILHRNYENSRSKSYSTMLKAKRKLNRDSITGRNNGEGKRRYTDNELKET